MFEAQDYLTLLCELFHLVAVLDLVDEDLRRLKTGNEMFVDDDSSIAGDVTSDFLFSLLIDKAAKAPDVDVLAARHILFND